MTAVLKYVGPQKPLNSLNTALLKAFGDDAYRYQVGFAR
jgi:hypothetical protein